MYVIPIHPSFVMWLVLLVVLLVVFYKYALTTNDIVLFSCFVGGL